MQLGQRVADIRVKSVENTNFGAKHLKRNILVPKLLLAIRLVLERTT